MPSPNSVALAPAKNARQCLNLILRHLGQAS
jgi:hypothetical protein